MLDKLDALARQGRGVSSDAVLDLVVDLFAARGDAMIPATRDACLDLLRTVMARATLEARSAAAARLAVLPITPAPLLLALAREPIAVAGPVLEGAANLPAGDLMRLVSEASPAHLRAVARRDTLSESVTDLIVLRGDREAITLCLLNRRARLSRTSLVALAEKARSDIGLRGALIHRSDLPDAVVERLWPLLDAGLKGRLLAAGWRYSMSEIEEVGREASAALVSAVRQGSLPQSVDTYRALIADGQVSASEALTEIVEAGRLVEAAQLVARTVGAAEGVVLNLLYGVYDRGLGMLARHAGLDDATVMLVACARSRLASIPGSDVRRTIKTYGETSRAEAAAIMDALEALWAAGIANGGSRRRFRAA